MAKGWKMKKPIALVAAIALTFSLMVAPGFANATDSTRESDALTLGTGTPEWAVDDGAAGASTVQAALSASFDMRDNGWVTPVKLQNPWGTCWAFGAISATESSILSSTGSTYDKTKFDLPERHLAWFATRAVTAAEDPAQAGEGNYPFKDGNDSYQTGGPNILVTTLFSQGVGPVTEQEFPYRGVGEDGTSHTTKPSLPYDEFEQNTEQGTLKVLAEMNNTTPEGEEAFLRDFAEKNHTTYEAELAEAISFVRGLYTNIEYSKNDDWSIPVTEGIGASNRFKHAGLIIKDGNVLPEYWNADRTAVNDASMTAMKQELANGHGIVINYKADQAQPGATSDNTFINKDTWAQYTFQNVQADHAVCIVGWDDNYSKENFAHYIFVRDPQTGAIVYDDEGNAQVYDNSLEMTTPPGDGAWIVKNSWGSQTDVTTDDLGNSIGYGEYGVRDADGKATGYFYLSYYDLTIQKPETMSFSSSLLGPTGLVSIFQHDYMTAQGGFYNVEPSGDVMSSANVFDLKKEDGDQVVLSVGGRTSDQDQRATFAIYQLNDGAMNPTDGKLLYRVSSNFDYAGYHRLDLERPLAIRAGYKYSIVSTVSSLDENGSRTYGVSANQGLSRMLREYMYNQLSERDKQRINPVYNVAVINEGESFLYKDGKWVDWSDYVNAIPAPPPDPGEPAVEKYIDVLPIDNFSIKMYAEPATITLTHQEAKAATCTEPGNIEYWYYDAIDATDTSEGLRMYYADEAGTKEISQADTVLPIGPNSHKWGAWTKFDEKQHQRVCEHNPLHVEKADHEWDGGGVTKEPSATQAGVRTYTCKVCGATHAESIAAKSSTTPKNGDTKTTSTAAKSSAASKASTPKNGDTKTESTAAKNSATTPKTGTPKTGDTLLFAAISGIVLAAAGAAAPAFANRRPRRD